MKKTTTAEMRDDGDGGFRRRATASYPREAKRVRLRSRLRDDKGGGSKRYQDNRDSGGGWRCGGDSVK